MQMLIAIWTLVTQLLPLVLQMIKTVEEQFPQGGQGQQKLAMVRDSLSHAFSAMGQTAVTFEQVWPAMQSIVAAAVTIYNNTGQFKKP